MLEVLGAVDVTVGGARAHLLARGNLVELDLDYPRRFVSAAGFGGWRALRALAVQLDGAGLTMRIQSRGPRSSPSAAKRAPVQPGGSWVFRIWKSTADCPSGGS